MTLSQATEIIEKFQENINDQLVRTDDVFAPDEYYLAVSAVLPVLMCLSCLTSYHGKDLSDGFIPRCKDESNFRPDVQYNPEDLPYVQKGHVSDDEELPFG